MRYLHVRQSRKHMATTFTFTLACPDSRAPAAHQTIDEAHRAVARLERELSEFLPESPVYQWNASRPGERVAFSVDGLALWNLSVALARQTNGAFHPLAKSQPSAVDADWDEKQDEGCPVKTREGQWLGFGAIGKGYALDRVRTIFEQAGFNDYLLSAGGSSQILSGFSAPQDPWRWGWSWKRDADGDDVGIALTHLSGQPIALGVSGFHEKGRHILQPRTGQPVQPWAQSACVAAPSAATADALSTALMAGQWESVGESSAKAVVDEAGVARCNAAFESLWGALAGLAILWLIPSLAWAEDTLEVAEEAIDLNSLGVTSFAPYAFERNAIWILLPLVTLFFVGLHLMKGPKKNVEIKTVDSGSES